jgi:lipase maturation factor 1
MLHVLCGSGTGLALLLVVGIAPVPCLVGLWTTYLSITSIGQDFLSFQWDILLCETGFLAIFLAPLGVRTRATGDPAPPKAIVWLLRWLVFRLMFSSGSVKLLSGDPTWRNLTALDYHYWTQPLPTWVGWYTSLLPERVERASCAVMFAIELLAPLLVWGGRGPRKLAFAAFVSLQLLILVTGNYGYFNWLTIALSVMLLDDDAWPAALRQRFAAREPQRGRPWPTAVTAVVTAVILFESILGTFTPRRLGAEWPDAVTAVRRSLAPLRLVGSYGLFAVMTTQRLEITVEGSDDGTTWKPYEFRWKPGNPARAPGFVAPHMPRLDWQMWFAALGSYEQNPWFLAFALRLLEGSPAVRGLLASDPFPDHPPRYLRATTASYRFTNLAERRETGRWWKTEPGGPYLPAVSIESFRRGGAEER